MTRGTCLPPFPVLITFLLVIPCSDPLEVYFETSKSTEGHIGHTRTFVIVGVNAKVASGYLDSLLRNEDQEGRPRTLGTQGHSIFSCRHWLTRVLLPSSHLPHGNGMTWDPPPWVTAHSASVMAV